MNYNYSTFKEVDLDKLIKIGYDERLGHIYESRNLISFHERSKNELVPHNHPISELLSEFIANINTEELTKLKHRISEGYLKKDILIVSRALLDIFKSLKITSFYFFGQHLYGWILAELLNDWFNSELDNVSLFVWEEPCYVVLDENGRLVYISLTVTNDLELKSKKYSMYKIKFLKILNDEDKYLEKFYVKDKDGKIIAVTDSEKFALDFSNETSVSKIKFKHFLGSITTTSIPNASIDDEYLQWMNQKNL